MKYCIIALVFVGLLFATNTCRRYRASEASDAEVMACKQALEAHLAELRSNSEARAKAPAFLAGADSFNVLKVEKSGALLKALVDFRSGSRTETRYVLVKNEGGTWKVAGIL
jgi:hypothetical protein